MRLKLLPNDPEVGRSPYFWLIYLGYFIAPYFIWRRTIYQDAIGVSAVAVFLVLNFRGYWLSGARLWRNSLLISALGIVTAPVNFGAAVFFIYSACFGAGFERAREGVALLVVNVVLAAATALVFKLNANFWMPAVILPVIIGLPVLYFSEIGRTRNRLLRKQEEVEHLTKLAERERIARDLHDVLGHTLSVITLKSELARKLVPRDPRGADREMREIETTSRDALSQVRQAISGYRSAGWAFELAQAGKILESAGVTLQVEGEEIAVPAPVENVLSLALREAVTNIVRHAAATRCCITLRHTRESVSCHIADDGVGVQSARWGNGLKGMRERVEFMGGELTVSCNQPGVRLALSLPVPHQERPWQTSPS